MNIIKNTGHSEGVPVFLMNLQYGLTQEDLAYKSGVSLFSVRELEQGKMSMRMDKVNQILGLFNYELVPQRKDASQS